jgi:CelD/BcsL family acetyltransferase involved in cellulose biosynthesis
VTSHRVELIERMGAMDALAGEWDALWRRTPAGTPFQSPAWLVPWWRRFEPGALALVTIRTGRRLVALVPLYREPPAEGNQVRLLGAGNSDYLDGLIEPGREAELAPAIVHVLEELREQGQEVRLERLAASSPLGRMVAGLRDALIEPDEPCPVLALPHAPRPCWKRVRYLRRRLGRMGGFRVARVTEPAELPGAMSALAALHEARWVEQGSGGVFADGRNASFLEDAAAALLGAGLLRCYVLHAGGRVLAAHFGMLAHGRAYYYIGGFDPAAAASSAGTVLVAQAVEEAEREGAHAFDFLRGSEAYKYRWGSEDQWTSRVVLMPACSPASGSR